MAEIIIRNYNRFLVGTPTNFRWDDFYIHRFPNDYDKLVRFNSIEEAERFRRSHPEIEKDYDAWIVEYPRIAWNH